MVISEKIEEIEVGHDLAPDWTLDRLSKNRSKFSVSMCSRIQNTRSPDSLRVVTYFL